MFPSSAIENAWPRRGLTAAFFGVALIAFGASAASAQEPSAAAIASAKEIINAKGTSRMFDPAVPGVIETAKNTFLRTNPSLTKDLNEVAAQLRTEYASKRNEIENEVARTYAEHFTEDELKQIVVFYKSPLGQKVIAQEPQVLEQTMARLSVWADRFADEVMDRMRADMKKRGHQL